jgi:hypothetical protein
MHVRGFLVCEAEVSDSLLMITTRLVVVRSRDTVHAVVAADDASRCGLCGRPTDGGHVHEWLDGPAVGAGRRIEYVIVGVRGEIARYQAAADPSTVYRTVAADLATQLGIDAADLVGRRFSCWVTPAQHGVVRSDYRRV